MTEANGGPRGDQGQSEAFPRYTTDWHIWLSADPYLLLDLLVVMASGFGIIRYKKVDAWAQRRPEMLFEAHRKYARRFGPPSRKVQRAIFKAIRAEHYKLLFKGDQ